MMFRHAFAVVSLVPALAVTAAEAQRGLQWVSRDGEDSIVLAYEVPNTSDQILHLGCDTKTREIRLSAQFDVKGPGPDKPVMLTFSHGGQSVSLKGRTETDELFPFVYPTASGFDPGPLLALLDGPGEVVVRAHKGSVTLAAAGRAKGVEAFRAKCPAR